MAEIGQKAKYSLRADVFRSTPNRRHSADGLACPRGADCVEKVCSLALPNFLGVVGAVFREGREGPHGVRPGQSKTPVVDLRPQSDETEDRIVIPTNFRQRLTFDFFNTIGPKPTCGPPHEMSAFWERADAMFYAYTPEPHLVPAHRLTGFTRSAPAAR